MQELYSLHELTKYNYVKSEVKNVYFQILDISVINYILERTIYFLRKNRINVNFMYLSYIIYLILNIK
jgi:hypothetical protein